ncbi:MAG: 3-dehydroquinate synthase [Bacteroidia bacterium]|nr:3-dehydroquinate synthase [Bacteroidia bacterium]
MTRQVPLFTLSGEEENKTLPTARWIWKKLWQYEIDRGQVILLIGGGTLLDMGGFCASVWKRGTPFISIPTTLVAQMDAAIGGKTGINFRSGKNILGSFAQPTAIWIWEGFLKTLPPRILKAGWVEGYKHALLYGEELLRKVEVCSFTQPPSSDLLRQLVEVKWHIVQQDPYESQGLRQALNLGHTLGHVWETLSLRTEAPLLHGEAIAIGLWQEIYLSTQLYGTSSTILDRLTDKLRREKLLIPLPPHTRALWEKLLLQDKKRRSGQLYLPLLREVGQVELQPVEIKYLWQAVQAYREMVE